MLNGRVLFSTSALCNPNANLDHGAKSSIATAKSEEKQVTGKFSVPLLLTFGLKITLIRVITALGFLVGAKVLNVQWWTKLMKAVNKADNDASARAFDSLIYDEMIL
ncbi:hypothetical protein GH714_042372 [Hevea brasiliensis]|uniref:Uncharacterized protein n=1 Tax=Hevea brasiliensis TaxID=3981 RepID=A0A6A6LD72_HEVBR|nr:hypothetical protein GH714_042372 [Hevea brasiliensis]